MGWLKSLFGKGTLCFELEGVDSKTGQRGSATFKQEYEGSLATLDMQEMERRIKLNCRMEGFLVDKIKYLGEV